MVGVTRNSNLNSIDTTGMPFTMVSLVTVSSAMLIPANNYKNLIIKITSTTGGSIKIFGRNDVGNSNGATLLKTISNTGTYTTDISSYNYIYFSKPANSSSNESATGTYTLSNN